MTMSTLNLPVVKRPIATVVAFYLAAAQFAILPAAIQSRAQDRSDATGNEYSLAHLVDWMARTAGDLDVDRMAAESAPAVAVAATDVVTTEQLDAAAADAVAEWQAVDPTLDLSTVTFSIADLGGLELGATTGTAITIDDDAAGHGWDVTFADAPAEHMDLATVVRHELGHALGLEHDTTGLMSATLAVGQTYEVPAPTAEEPTADEPAAGTEVPAEEPALAEEPAPVVEPASAWVVDGATATLAATASLDATLVHDAAAGTLALVDAAGADTLDLAGLSVVEVRGTDGSDRVVLGFTSALSVALRVDLGAGTDELVGPAVDGSWTVDGADGGTVLGVTFAGVENITGAADNQDTFVVTGTGSISGLLEGGDGGFDVIELAGGDFAVFRSVVTAADAGVITRDADTLTYAGMEPVHVTNAGANHEYHGTAAAEIISIVDSLTPDAIDIVFRDLAGVATGETHTVALAGVATITFDGLGGNDRLRLDSVDPLLGGVQLIWADSSGTGDVLDVSLLDYPGTWTLLGINAGTWSGTDGSLGGDGDLDISYSGVETLAGATTADETYDLGPGGFVGAIDNTGGTLTIVLAGSTVFTGVGDFTTGTYDLETTDGYSYAGAQVLGLAIEYGTLSQNLGSGVTLDAASADFGIALISDGTDTWQVAGALLSDVSLNNGSLTLVATSASLLYNGASASHGAIIFTSAPLVIGTLTSGPITITAADESFVVTATDVRVTTGGFLWITGTLTIEIGFARTLTVDTLGLDDDSALSAAIAAVAAQQGVDGVDPADRVAYDAGTGTITNLPVQTATIGITEASVFAGTNPAGFGIFTAPDPAATGAQGVLVSAMSVGAVMAFARNPELDALLPQFVTLQVTIGNLDALTGVTGLVVSLKNATATWNSGDAITGDADSSAWVDWAASYPGVTPGLALPVPGSTDPSPLVFDAADTILRVDADRVLLSYADYITVTGSFAMEHGGTVSASVVTEDTGADGTTSVDVDTTLIGIGDAAFFVGVPNGFSASIDGFTCAEADAAGAFGGCFDDLDLAMVFASASDQVAPFTSSLPSFVTVQGGEADLTIVGLPDWLTLEMNQTTFNVNLGGELAGTPGSNAYIDWSLFDSGAGLVVPVGPVETVVVDVDDDVIGLASELALLKVGDFLAIAGSLAFEYGNTTAVTIGVDILDATEEAAFQAAVDAATGLAYDGEFLTGLEVVTTTLGWGGTSVFLGYDSVGLTDGGVFDCTGAVNAGAYGLCLDGVSVALALSSVTTPDAIAGYVLPDFVSTRIDLSALSLLDLLGLENDFFTLEFDGLRLDVNTGQALSDDTGTDIEGTTVWIDWSVTPYDVPNGSGVATIDLAEPAIALAADTALLAIGDFLAFRGSFRFEFGGFETFNVHVAGLDATQESSLAAAATAAGISLTDDVLLGVEMVTNVFGIGDAQAFVGYFPGGFDIATPIDCDGSVTPLPGDAFGMCFEGIDIGIATATVRDADLLVDGSGNGWRLPNFTAVQVDLTTFDLVGLPQAVRDVLDIDFYNLRLAINSGGAISSVASNTATAVADSQTWINFLTSGGLTIDTPGGTQTITLDDPIIGVAAERAYVIVNDFVSVVGSFAFEKGAIIDLGVDTPTLNGTQRTTLEGQISNAAYDGDNTLVIDGVQTTTFGIGEASIYVGYAPDGFDHDVTLATAGQPVGDFYGLAATGIDVGVIWAGLAATRYASATYRLPTFFGLTAAIENLTFAGLPTEVGQLVVNGATAGYNGQGVITGFGPSDLAHANWAASTDSSGTVDGIAIPTGLDTAITIGHDDPIIGLAADEVILTIGSFIHVSGSFAFEQGGQELVDVDVIGLSVAEYAALQTALATEDPFLTGSAAAITTINDVLVQTTKLGIADATVFVGYVPGGFPAATAIDCTETADGQALADAFGFCIDDASFGMVIADALNDPFGSYTLPQFLALRGELPSFDINQNLIGLPDLSEFQLYFEGLEVVYNSRSAITGTVGASAWIDWEQSYSDQAADGLEIPVSADPAVDPIVIDLATPLLGIGADVVVLSISDFVHVSGGFAFTMGEIITADVDVVPTVGSLPGPNDVVFQTTTFGITNGAVFVGYNPNADGTGGSSFDIGADKVFTIDDLDGDAVGILLSDLDLGMVFATAEANLQGWKLPTFTGLRAANAEFDLINLLPDFIKFRIEDLGATYTSGGTATKLTTSGRASLDWSSVGESAQGAGDGGYDIPTSPDTTITLDVRGEVIGVEAGLVVFTISEFVHISGGFSFTKGELVEVDIDVNDGTAATSIATSTILVGDTDDLTIRRTLNGKRLFNVLVETLQIGISDASIFVGYANLGGSDVIDLGDDDILTQEDVPNAFGLLISDVDFAMVISDIVNGQLPAALKSIIGAPTFTTIKAFGEQVVLLGLEDLLTFEANGVAVELNFGKSWTTNGSGDITPAIDWASAFGSGGHEVATGPGGDPLFLTMDGYLIGGGAELVVISILDFIHVRGSFYFEKGVTAEVPLQSLFDVSFLPDELEAFATGPKTLRFFNIGIADTYAFVGVGGPHWITVDAADATSDLRFECDPLALDYGSCVDATHCGDDTDTADGIARAIDADRCRTVVRGSASDTFTTDDTPLGIAVSDLDVALAIGTPSAILPGVTDPTKYITLRASVEYAGLIGFEEYGLTAKLVGVALELNITTPTLQGFPILPAIDWAQYALDNGCTEADVAAGATTDPNCGAFGVKTGQRDTDDIDGDGDTTELLTEKFFYDGLFVRAAIRHFVADIFGVIAVNGSVAFNLGPTETVTLKDGTVVPGVLTMTLGGSDIFGFVGIDGPFWTEDAEGRIQWECDPDGPNAGSCDDVTDCSYAAAQNPGDNDDCRYVANPDAIGLALEDLDFGLFVGLKIPAPNDPSQPGDETAAGVYIAANLTVGGIGLVGVPGVDANLAIAVSLNLGFTLGGGGASASAINFRDSFTYDEAPGDPDFDGDGVAGELGQGGYLLDTGNPNAPMVIAYEDTFISVQMVGYINIVDVARIDGIFYLGVDLDAGSEEFRLLALGQMRIGSDVSDDTTTEPIVSIGALGVLILNSDGVAGDFTVELDLNVPLLEVEVGARVLFNSGSTDQVLELPDLLYDYLDQIRKDEFAGDTGGLDDPVGLVSELLDRLQPCADDTDGDPTNDRCYVISGQAPELITGAGVTLDFNQDTVEALLGDDSKTVTYVGNGPYIAVVLSGSITIAGFAKFEGLGVIAVSGDAFQLGLAVTFQIGSNPAVSLNVGAKAVAIVDANGFAMNANVVINANLLSVFDLAVAGSLAIDTRPGNEVFQLALVGSVSVLGVISLDGTVLIIVGGELGANAFYAGIDLSADLGPLELHAQGFISSWGSFQLGFSGDIDLTLAGTGIQGGISANVSYCYRQGEPDPGNTTCRDNLVSYVQIIDPVSVGDPFGVVVNIPQNVKDAIQSYQTESGPLCSGTEDITGNDDPCAAAAAFARSFLAEISGYVRVKLFGITLAGVSISVSVGGYLGDVVKVKAKFTVETFFGDFSKTVTIATFRIPSALINSDVPPPNLADIESGVLVLNVGSRANLRTVCQDEIDEDYLIFRKGDLIYVQACGYSETHNAADVTSISGNFGSGDDVLLIYSGVGKSVTAYGGDGNDDLSTADFSSVYFYGQGGNDILMGSTVNDVLDGGLGNDYIDGGAGVDTIIGGPGSGEGTDDDTFFGYGQHLAGETVQAGFGYDRMEIVGFDAPEAVNLYTDGPDLKLTYGLPTAFTLTGIDELQLGLSGGDDLTVDGAVESHLDVLTIFSAGYRAQVLVTQQMIDDGVKKDDGSAFAVGDVLVSELVSNDTVTINLLAGADAVNVTAATAPHPPTFSLGDAAVRVDPSTTYDDVPTLYVDWLGRILFTIVNTGLASNNHDEVTLNLLGGNDLVAVASLKADLTVDLGNGNDEVLVGSTALCSTSSCASTGSSNVGTIDGPLHLIGGGGSNDRALVDDRGDGSGDDFELTSSTLVGLDLYAGAIGTAGIVYGGFEVLDIDLGGGADDGFVQSTAGIATTTIRGFGGNDDLQLSSDASIAGGAPAGTIDGVAGDLVFDGGTGTDTILIVDAADTTGDTGYITLDTLSGFSAGDIRFVSVADVDITLGTGDDSLGIRSLQGTITTADIDGNDGDDWFDVDGFDAGTLTILGGIGDDHFDVGSRATLDHRTASSGGVLDDIDGLLVLDGQAPTASDHLYVDDTGYTLGRTGVVTRSTIVGFGMASMIDYTSIEHVTISLGSGVDVVDVTSTNGIGDAPVATTETTLNLGGGNDVVNVSSNAPTNTGLLDTILGHLIVNGQGGVDTVNASDIADTTDNVGALTATDLTGLGMGPDGITYGTLEYLNIDLGSGSDTFTVHSTHVGETTLDTRGGDDLVDVGAAAAAQVLTGIDGFLDIDTGAGTDTLEINAQQSAVETVGAITGTTITGLDTEIDPRNEASDRTDVVTILDGSFGTVALTIGGVEVSFALNATADEVRDAIAAALGAAAGDIRVSRTSLIRQDGTTFRITYVGAYAGQAGHDLGPLTVGDVDLSGVTGFADRPAPSAEVLTSTDGRIEYTSVEHLDVFLGDHAEYVELHQTGAITDINAGDGADVIDVEIVDHETFVVGGDGRDTIQVNAFPNTPDTNDINALLHLDGEQGEDTIFIQLSSTQESFIQAFDSGTDVGVDDLIVQGSEVNDQFLLRSFFVALLNGFDIGLEQYTNAEFVHYDEGIENLIINTLGGNDSVAFDDTSVATTVNLGDGEDFIQVGQLFGDECLTDPMPGFVPDQGAGTLQGDDGCFDDRFVPPFLIDSTQGMLSNGISQSTTVNGGDGNDLMIVFRNRAVLTLNGEDGDDTFVIRTFLEEDSETQLDAGQGTDVISYIMNAPVNVNGGDGYDRLYIIGTEADDVFVVTEDGIYGAGRFISFVAIELLGIDTVEGNDYVYVQSTDPNVAVEIYGGLGSDTIEVGSNLVPTIVEADGTTYYRPIYAAADDLVGHSGLVVHNIENGIHAGMTIDGIAAEVVDDDEPAVLITESGGTTIVAERDGTTGWTEYGVDTYTVVLTSAPSTEVLVEALTAVLTPDQINGDFGPEFNVELSLDGGVTWSERGVVLTFDASNWYVAQTVWVRAKADNGQEGDLVTAVRHTVGAQVTGTVDFGTVDMLFDLGAFSDGAGGFIDYSGKTLIVEFPTENRSYTVLSNDADSLTIEGVFEDIPLNSYVYTLRGLGAFGEVVLNDLFIRIVDNDLSEVVIIESGVDTTVAEDGTFSDTFQLGRTWGAGTAGLLTVDLAVPAGLCVSLTVGGACITTIDLAKGALVTLHVAGVQDSTVEGFQYTTIVFGAAGDIVGKLLVGQTDDDDLSVLVVESDGHTTVAEGDFGDGPDAVLDSYTMTLTASPAAGETITVNAEAIATRTQYDAGDQIGTTTQCPDARIVGDRMTCEAVQVELRFREVGTSTWSAWGFSHDLVFTEDNWSTGFEVQLRAVQDDWIDGRILQAFPEAPARVNRIQGSLYVDGGPSAFGYPLDNFRPVMLPGETSEPITITPNPAFDVIEASAVDTLVIHNEDDVADSELTLTTATATPTQLSEEFAAYLEDLDALPEQPDDTPVQRYALLGLGMGELGIQYDGLEVLDVYLGSGSDDVTILTTHDGTTTIRGHEGDDEFFVVEILGHTRILGGDDDDTITVTDGGLLESIDAQLLISGEAGDDTTIVDDSADDRADDADDDLGTLTQTSLVGLDMVSTTVDNMFSLELSDDATTYVIHVTAYRAPGTLDVDDPGVDVAADIVIDDAAIAALAALGALPYGDYSAYATATVADMDAYLLAGLIQHALFPHQEPTDPFDYVENPDGSRTYTHANGDTDDDRFPTTGCGRTGTTEERDSRCANSVYVWDADGRVYLIGFQGELAGLDVTFSVTTDTGTYATDLLRTDGITYDTLETLDIRLGDGHDRFNVRGTLPHTLLDTGDGDDVVFVSDAADLGYLPTALTLSDRDLELLHELALHGQVTYDDHDYFGSLDEVDGQLDIDTGDGSNTLAVSDHDDPDADLGFTITASTIVGLATGAMSYTSTGGDLAGQGWWTLLHDAGMFGRGITVHLSEAGDEGTIASVRGGTDGVPFGFTVTTVYGNTGDDDITVTAPDVAAALLVVHGDEGDDTVDGGTAGLALDLFGDEGFDTLTGGSNADRIVGDDGRVYFLRTGTVGHDVVLGGDPRTADLANPHTGVVVAADDDFDTVEVILTRVTSIGATGNDGTVLIGDVLRGNAGNDIVLGGAAADTIDGDAGNDLLFGDFAWIGANPGGDVDGAYLPMSMAVVTHPFTFTSRDITDANGAGDTIRGGTGEDIILGQQGSDALFGGADDDDLLGGHDVAGGHDAGDVMDGGTGNDVLTGDNALVLRTGDDVTTRVRALSGTTLVGGVTGTAQHNPTGVEVRSITLLDHAVGTSALLYGNDTMAGGADDDVVFGQLGNDTIHGDGSTDTAGVVEAALDTTTDGDDYVEGNGGGDVILGGLGQDDLIGGSSDLFGLTTAAMRPDGVDTVYGGNGDHAGRNDLGLTGDAAYSRDADVIVGDNGRIFRIVGTNGASSGAYLRFNHDLSCTAGAQCIVPRVVQDLDYSPVGESYWLAVVDPAAPVWVVVTTTNIGGGDFLHGESSNDIIHGLTGQDAIFGDAGDDDLFGGANRDWISGGTGNDGIIADHGWINTSRHGLTEPLYGVTTATRQQVIDTPGDLQSATINQTGTLHKAVELDLELVVVTVGGTPRTVTTFYIGDHDIVYGGWGNDFIHGGEGDDMLSGAEALDSYYVDDPFALLRTLYPYLDELDGILQHSVERAGEFRCYDEFTPLAMVYVCDANAVPTLDLDGDGVADVSDLVPFLTNNDATENAAAGGPGDGEDVIFGDGGNDWIIGGVNHDRAFGGWGDDLLDMDDDKSTASGANDEPDAQPGPPTYADIAYGGAGRDVLIANTGADRLIDWVGEYNSYIVPFSPYGAFAISRSIAPHLFTYLYDLSEAEGADVTRGGDVARNGEPYGELGLVTQQDEAWQDQTGAPDDPQAGNTQGPRDVLRAEDFSSASTATTAFAVDSGSWTVTNGRYESVAVIDRDAISLFYVDSILPSQYEVLATVNADKDKAGYRSNAYIVFDYMGATDFKFAGLEMGNDKVQIGRRTATGWQVLSFVVMQLAPNRDYDLRLWVDGQVVVLYVDGVEKLRHDFGSPLLVPGEPATALDPLTDGMIGVGSDGSISRVSYMAVQVLAPTITFTISDEFGVAPGYDDLRGGWTLAAGRLTGTTAPGGLALTTTTLTVASSALLELDTIVTTDGVAGIAFDVLSADRFKLVALDTANGLLLFGHVVAGVWVVDHQVAVNLTPGSSYALRVTLDGATAHVTIDGEPVGAYTWHSLLNDGAVGLLVRDGTASFDHLALSTDDPALEPVVPFVSVTDAQVLEGDDGRTDLVVTVRLSRVHDEDVRISWSTADGTAVAGEDYVAASGTLVIAAGALTGQVVLQVLGDLEVELDETFTLNLYGPVGAIIGDGSALLLIANEDVLQVLDVGVLDGAASEAGGNAVITITRTGDTAGALVAELAWTGSAGYAVDYTVQVQGGQLSTDGSLLTIGDGVDVVTLTIVPIADSLGEVTEDIVLTVTATQDYGVGTATGTVTLSDDSVLPKLSIDDVSVVEGNRGAVWATLTVTLDAPSAQTVTVEVRTYEGTATAGVDFRTLVTTITFAAGTTTQTVRIRIESDRTREFDEVLTVELSHPVGAVLADAVGQVTIIDDDGGAMLASVVGTTGRGTTPTAGMLAEAMDVAIAWWVARGEDAAAFAGVELSVVDLDGRTLAVTTLSGILLDADAAGHGWTRSGAAGMDLVSVLVHELGHVLGLDHDVDGADVALARVMTPVLVPGARLVTVPLDALGRPVGAEDVMDVVAVVATPRTAPSAPDLSDRGVAAPIPTDTRVLVTVERVPGSRASLPLLVLLGIALLAAAATAVRGQRVGARVGVDGPVGGGQ